MDLFFHHKEEIERTFKIWHSSSSKYTVYIYGIIKMKPPLYY
jgi:hypothetical protein